MSERNTYDSAIHYFKPLEICDAAKDTSHIAKALNGIATVNFYLKNFDAAIEYFLSEEELNLTSLRDLTHRSNGIKISFGNIINSLLSPLFTLR